MYADTKKDDNVENLKNAARDSVNDVSAEFAHAANKAGRKVRSFIDTASEDFTHVSETVTTEIRSNPVQSSLIALGVGIVLGKLFFR